jgi:transposase-like protein
MPWKEVSTVSLRLEFVKLVLANGNISKLSREFGISRKTGYKWL